MMDATENGPVEAIARAIHDRWCKEQRATGNAPPRWPELDESRQNSSRSQARDIAVKLSSIGCTIAPLSDTSPTGFAFTEQEIETLAFAEHNRWVDERRAAGWTLGERDTDRKRTPYLVPFNELPGDIAEYDRMFVREIPALLGTVGLRVVRSKPK
jgi:RyR domain